MPVTALALPIPFCSVLSWLHRATMAACIGYKGLAESDFSLALLPLQPSLKFEKKKYLYLTFCVCPWHIFTLFVLWGINRSPMVALFNENHFGISLFACQLNRWPTFITIHCILKAHGSHYPTTEYLKKWQTLSSFLFKNTSISETGGYICQWTDPVSTAYDCNIWIHKSTCTP